ncbi:hypothetical protein LY76DRAFT_609128 [Colletotrichum caudatum]|nr:hypothetical protein LY76DRAFT_609128 [Colletotrichum caudatum]
MASAVEAQPSWLLRVVVVVVVVVAVVVGGCGHALTVPLAKHFSRVRPAGSVSVERRRYCYHVLSLPPRPRIWSISQLSVGRPHVSVQKKPHGCPNFASEAVSLSVQGSRGLERHKAYLYAVKLLRVFGLSSSTTVGGNVRTNLFVSGRRIGSRPCTLLARQGSAFVGRVTSSALPCPAMPAAAGYRLTLDCY